MTIQPFERALSVTRSVLASVTPDQLHNSTPCTAWDVSALINHIIGVQHFFVAGMNATPPAAAPDYAAGDYVAAFDEASAASRACFGADGALERLVTLPFGQMPGAAVLGLAITDTFQHGWDLAKATGQDTNLAPELAAGVLAQARQSVPDAFRGPQGAPFGTEQVAPEGACPADELAAFLGREV